MKYRIYKKDSDNFEFDEYEKPEDVWDILSRSSIEDDLQVYLMTNPPACIAYKNTVLWTNVANTFDKNKEVIDTVQALIKCNPSADVIGSFESVADWGVSYDKYESK